MPDQSLKKQRYKVISSVLKKLYPSPSFPLRYETPFQALIVIVLSARNTDKKVNQVSPLLFQHYPDARSLSAAPLKKIENLISSLNYYRTKARYIKEIASIVHKRYKDKVPSSMTELLQLPGVGRKTANAFLWAVFQKPEGIVVDTHVARLSRVYGLSSESNPIKIEKELMEIVPPKEWGVFPLRLIYYGREFCPARKHPHHNCPLYKALKQKGIET